MSGQKLSPIEEGGIARVQVGCGPKNIKPDWWNVDIRPFPGIDAVMDVTKVWPWRGVLDYVYGEHFLEHLSLSDAIDFLTHSRAALKHGGALRLTTPSVEWVLRTHFKFNDAGVDAKMNETFAINRAFHGWGHQFLYSKDMLEQLIAACGLTLRGFYDYGDSDDESLKGLEQHGGWSVAEGYPSVWIIEAVKSEECSDEVTSNFRALAEEKFLRYVASGH